MSVRIAVSESVSGAAIAAIGATASVIASVTAETVAADLVHHSVVAKTLTHIRRAVTTASVSAKIDTAAMIAATTGGSGATGGESDATKKSVHVETATCLTTAVVVVVVPAAEIAVIVVIVKGREREIRRHLGPRKSQRRILLTLPLLAHASGGWSIGTSNHQTTTMFRQSKPNSQACSHFRVHLANRLWT